MGTAKMELATAIKDSEDTIVRFHVSSTIQQSNNQTVTDCDIDFTALNSTDKELFMFGGCNSDDPSGASIDMKYKFRDGSTCETKSQFPGKVEYFFSAHVFGTTWVCGGQVCPTPFTGRAFSDQCWKFDKYHQDWEQEDSLLNYTRSNGGSIALKEKASSKHSLVIISSTPFQLKPFREERRQDFGG